MGVAATLPELSEWTIPSIFYTNFSFLQDIQWISVSRIVVLVDHYQRSG